MSDADNVAYAHRRRVSVTSVSPRSEPGFVTLLLTLLLTSCAGEDPDVRVAVAANFTEPAREIVALFAETTGHLAAPSFGSTGQLYAQITEGAPFEVFLAADTETPARLVGEGFALAGSRFTYAVGQIALYSRTLELGEPERLLRRGDFDRLAIANPETAPYGAAALEAIESLGIREILEGRFVLGNSIAQTFQFVETGNAELGFVAMSQVREANGAVWPVPQELYSPIRQDAVLLARGAANEAAAAFMSFLAGPEARAVVESYGYLR